MLQARKVSRICPHAVERWLTVAEVAERLRLSTATVYALCKRGALRHARVANAIRIDEQALQELVGAAR